MRAEATRLGVTFDKDDVVQACLLIWLTRLKKNPELLQLGWTRQIINRIVIDGIRSVKGRGGDKASLEKKARHISWSARFGQTNFSLEDVVACPHKARIPGQSLLQKEERQERDERMSRLMTPLKGRHLKLIKLYIKGLKLKEIADVLGCDPSRVSQLFDEAKEAIRTGIPVPVFKPKGKKKKKPKPRT